MTPACFFPETLELHKRLEDFFGWKIESIVPDLTVEQQAEAHGPELWKRDPDLCCTMRKVLPLQSKLRDLDCWITGLRRNQSESRAGIGVIELYTLNGNSGPDIVKLNPMANWSREAIWDYIRKHKIPYNPLARPGLPLHRLHDLHAQDRRGRRRTGRTLDRLQKSRMRHSHLHVAQDRFPDLTGNGIFLNALKMDRSPSSAPSEQLKIVIVGHVDHGKSTFVGRLFHDTGSLPEGKLEQLQAVAERRGVPFEWANLMDALQAERDQNITIDTAQIWFQTQKAPIRHH